MLSKVYINYLIILMTSNEKKSKLQSCRSRWELQFSYKIHLHPILYEKDMIFLRSDLAWQGCTVTPVEWRDKLDTWNMRWQTPSERSEACQHGTPCHANACSATTYFCHATRTGATKRVRSVNIYIRVSYF